MAESNAKEMRYKFVPIHSCNMCGSSASSQKVIGKRLNVSQGRKPEKKIGITTTIVRCGNCGLIYSNPLPIPFDIQDHYGMPPEDYWKRKDDYFTIADHYYKKELGILKSVLDFKEGMKLLEIGAGIGKGMIAATRVGFDAYGVEASQPFYDRAISRMGIAPDHIKLAMVEDADYPENQFDVIMMMAVLEHFYDATEVLERSMKWLKPGGLVFIEVPSSDWLISRLMNMYYKVTGRDYVGNLSPMHPPYHLYEFTLKTFQENAKKLNYDIPYFEYQVCDTYMPKIVDFFIRPYMKSTNKGMQLIVVLRKK